MNVSDVCIVSAARTPIGSFNGAFTSLQAFELGAIVIKEALERAKINPNEVAEVIIGQVMNSGQGQNPARQAAVKAGIPYKVPAYQIQMLCGSGVKSIYVGYSAIKLGDSDIVVCGGQESMTRMPYICQLRNGVKMGNIDLKDSLISDGLTDAFKNIHMGVTAENVAQQYSISREEQDKYALQSQLRTNTAQTEGYFKKEIVPVNLPNGKVIAEDEFPEPNTSIESLQKLRSCFIKGGTVTRGNASGINDGAAAIVLMKSTTAKERGLKPLGRLVAFSQCGLEPEIMGMGPLYAINSLFVKTGWNKDDVDLYEINEAFASQSVAVLRELHLDPSKVNITGGAIALGHPIGCSGTRIIVTLLHNLERTNGKKGIASLCIGGGMGIAVAIERD